eukprot:3450935-Amphidinium_carterae.1
MECPCSLGARRKPFGVLLVMGIRNNKKTHYSIPATTASYLTQSTSTLTTALTSCTSHKER